MKTKLLALSLAALMLLGGLCGCTAVDEAPDTASTTTTTEAAADDTTAEVTSTTTTTITPITAITRITTTTATSERMVWIPTRGGTKYHKTNTCSNMIEPYDVTVSEAVRLGFAPCKRCYG